MICKQNNLICKQNLVYIYIYIVHNSWGDWSLGKTFDVLSIHLLDSLVLMDLFIYFYFLENDLFLRIWLGFENEREKILLFNLQ